MKSLAQRKIDAKNSGWAWTIDHPNDERALTEGCFPDHAAAERVHKFFRTLLKIPSEEGGVKEFMLLKWWYRDVLAPLFGWKRADGRRRFDKGFITTAKKSGKSSVLAGLPLYMMLADGEEEAECYSAAVDRDQASIIFKKTSRMAHLSPHLNPVVKCIDSQKRIVHHGSGSWYEAISSDADSAEGKNPHLLIADELHVWRNRQFFNALMYGDIARRQPMFLMITTAGDDLNSVGYEEYEFAKDLLNPNTDFYSQSHFAFIAEAKEDREWDDQEGWQEANPSLKEGIGSVEKLQAKCDEAKRSPRKKREFIRYINNRWNYGTDDAWLDYDAWMECGKQPLVTTDGCEVYGGLDLSTSKDLTSLCLASQCDDIIDLRWWHWCPEDKVKDFEELWRVPLRDWVDKGYVTPTPGNVVDYAYIRWLISGGGEMFVPVEDRKVGHVPLSEQFDIRMIGFDRWNHLKLVSELQDQDGIEMGEIGQGYRDMAMPSQQFERYVSGCEFRTGNNPVANWMASHCAKDEDAAGNKKPTKKKSRHKIDGIVAAIMAVGLLTKAQEASAYDSPGQGVVLL